MSASCGFWPTSRGSLLAAIVDLDGLLIAIEVLPDDDEDRSAWISRAQYLYGPFLELVLSESLVRHDGFGRTALVLGHRVWVAPSELVHALARAAWYPPRLANSPPCLPAGRASLASDLPCVAFLRIPVPGSSSSSPEPES